MLSTHTKYIIGITVFALAVAGGAWLYPLSTDPERIVGVDGGDSHDITLEQGKALLQTMRPATGTYSGVVLYIDTYTSKGENIHVRVLDDHGRAIAKSYGMRRVYDSDGDTVQLEFFTSWFTVEKGASYSLEVTLVRGDPLSLRGITHPNYSDPLLSISLMKRIPTSFELRQGISIGSAFFIAVALLSYIKNQRKKYWAAIILIIVFAPLATLGYWFSAGDLGIADWDFYFTLHDSYRKAIVENHTFPFWNPYICGGTAGLGDPEFPMFSPTFALELLFGIPLGVRLAIALSVIITATGMLTLARALGRSVEAGLIAALAVAFGTVSLLEITEGHVNVLAAMWIPWILWSYLAVYRGERKPIVCGAFLALTFLGGGIYLLMYTAFAFLALMLLVPNHRRALVSTIQAGLWALGFASFKLVPVLYWLKQFPDEAYASSAYTLPWIVDILFGRHLHGSYIITDQASGWHEYGAYIGYVVLGLALIGISRMRVSRIIRSLLITSIVVLFISAMGPVLKSVFDPLWFFPRSNISRLILFAVIPLSLLAAYGADRIAKVFPKGGAIARTVLVGIIAIDIISLTYQLSGQAFVLPHVVPFIAPAPYPIAYTTNRYDQQGQGARTTRSFDAYKAGYGTFAYCSVLGPTPSVRTIHDEGDTSIVSAVDDRATIALTSWNYNTVRVHVDTPVATLVVLNANYVDGWTVNGKQARIFSNRVAADVEAGSHDIVFSYEAPGFRVGVLGTLCTFVLWFLFRMRARDTAKSLQGRQNHLG